jgi:small redox-active disulfide protein 2
MENKITSIEVIGSGCANCKKLHGQVIAAAKELGMDIEVGYSDDIQKALGMGVLQLPVLAINGKAVLAGSADAEKIKKVLKDNASGSDVSGCCPCGGDCGCL